MSSFNLYHAGYEQGQFDAWMQMTHNGCIDYVPVVRCKDCRHMTVETGLRYCNVWERFNGHGDDGYCCYGERKDGANDEP